MGKYQWLNKRTLIIKKKDENNVDKYVMSAKYK